MITLAQILWQAPRLMPLAIVIAIVTILVVLVFYVPQTRRLNQPWRWGLPLLRLIVGIMLALSIAQPALLRSESAEDPGALVVLVDSSRSMGVVDPRTPAERVAIADALGALPANIRSSVAPGLDGELDAHLKRLDELAAARADADYAKLSGQGVIAAQSRYEALSAQVSSHAAELARRGAAMPGPSDLGAKLAALATPAASEAGHRARVAAVKAALGAAQATADASLYDSQPLVRRACDDVASLTRAQIAQRAINRAKGSVLSSLPASGVYGFAFADALQSLAPTAATSKPSMDANGISTDIVGAVRAAADRMKGRLVQAIVVLTDGRQVGGDGAVPSSLAAGNVPVYPVVVAASSPRDISIADVTIAHRQFVGERTTARVRLRGSGMKGVHVDVKLEGPGQSQTRAVTFADQETATIDIPLKFDTAGVHAVTITAAPQDGEVTTVNNSVRRWVVATPDRAAVALVGAAATWDFQNVRGALARASWASIEAEVLDAPGARWSVRPDAIVERSAVVLFDVSVDQLTPAQWDALYEFVTARGGSLIFVAGRNTSAPEFIDSLQLTDLLPFRAGARPSWRTWSGEQALFRFQPAPAAADAPALRLRDDAASSVEQWLSLPAVFQYLPVTDLKPNTTPLLVERDSGLAVLTESRLGKGRVLFFGANETWRWRRGADGADQERFWQQLVRYAVDAPYATRNGPLRLDADRVALRPGESLRVRAKISHDDESATDEMPQSLTLVRDAALLRTVPLAYEPNSPGRYTATLDNLAAGTYELQLRDPLDVSVVATLPVYVEPDEESEMRDVSADERTVRRLAASSGGEMLTIAQWNTLPQRLAAAHQAGRQVAEQSLWDSPQLFAFLLGCLGIEWAMRKRLGLA